MKERPPLRLIEGGGQPSPPEPRPLQAGVAPAFELIALGIGLTLSIVLMARVPFWFRDLGTFQLLFAIAFAFYALALLRIERYAKLPGVGIAIFAVALATRAALLPTPPSLSGDIYRYVWEGKVVAHGGNPYVQTPLDLELAPLRDTEIFPHINHPELSTIYPPASIGGFALVAAVSPTIKAAKLWVILHDLALVLVLLAWARREGRSEALVAAYAWNPLMLVEYAGSGHNDPTAMLWLAVALMLRDSRPMVSAASLALGVLTKLAPLVALPFLLRAWPWRARVLSLVALGAGLTWFWTQTQHADSGVLAYWRTWRNNELLFHYLQAWTGSFDAARAIGGGLLVGALMFAWWKRWGAARASRLGARVALLVGPVLHPWYLGWALIFEPRAVSAPWLLLSLTAILNYGILGTPAEGRDFHVSLGWRWVEYGVPLALGIVLAIVAWRRRAARNDASPGT